MRQTPIERALNKYLILVLVVLEMPRILPYSVANKYVDSLGKYPHCDWDFG